MAKKYTANDETTGLALLAGCLLIFVCYVALFAIGGWAIPIVWNSLLVPNAGWAPEIQWYHAEAGIFVFLLLRSAFR